MGVFDSLKSYKAGYDAAQALIDKNRFWDYVKEGNIPGVKRALKAGADPENSSLCSHYPNSEAILKLLLDAGADPNYTNPLLGLPSQLNHAISDYFNVALFGNDIKSYCFESIKLLLKAGADPNSRGFNGMPLEVAVAKGDKKLIKLLLDAGAKS